MKIVFVASIIRNSLCIIYAFLLFFSKITFSSRVGGKKSLKNGQQSPSRVGGKKSLENGQQSPQSPSRVGGKKSLENGQQVLKVLQELEAKSPWEMGKAIQELEVTRLRKMGISFRWKHKVPGKYHL